MTKNLEKFGSLEETIGSLEKSRNTLHYFAFKKENFSLHESQYLENLSITLCIQIQALNEIKHLYE